MEASRRDVLHGAAAVGAAVAVSACAGVREAEAATGGDAHAERPGGRGVRLARVAEIPVGGGKVFEDKGVVVTQPAEGTFRAFSAACTHQGCTLSGVSGAAAHCPCHGSMFRVSDGSVARGPASEPLAPKRIRVAGGVIYLV
ncbi:Rieske (2Fe-2S) protein [Streptomyces sp. NPDC048270]|uniref:Rieske (2Fe-2S) protein n=1 Tax=Streptomyces sp. NPDC048270 TaxID=3154615 RepID=UPI0033EF7B07